MSGKALTRTVLVLSLVIVQAANASDHGLHGGVAASNSGRQGRPALATIYSNLGSSTDTYNDTNGWQVFGPTAGFGFSQWIGMPFTPNRNSTVTQIKIAVGWDKSGTNGFTLCLAVVGPPFTCMRTWDLTNLPTFGTCCRLDVKGVKPGYKVTKGKQYCVVAMTDATTSNTIDYWDLTWNQQGGTIYVNYNDTIWRSETGMALSAFGVFGTIP